MPSKQQMRNNRKYHNGKLEEHQLTLEITWVQSRASPVLPATSIYSISIGSSLLEKEDLMKQHAEKEKPTNGMLPHFSLRLLTDLPQSTEFHFLQMKHFVHEYLLMVSEPKSRQAYSKYVSVLSSAYPNVAFLLSLYYQ